MATGEIRIRTHWRKYFNQEQKDQQMCLNLNLLVEKRELTLSRVAEY